MKKRRITSLIIAAVAVISVAVLASSCKSGKDPSTGNADKPIRIGIGMYESKSYLYESDGQFDFDVEFASAVCKKLGYTPEFTDLTGQSMKDALEGGTVDCIWTALPITVENSEFARFTDPYMVSRPVFVVRAENLNALSSREGLAGAEICAAKDSVAEKTALSDEIFAYCVYISIEDGESVLIPVNDGKYDGCIVDYYDFISLRGDGAFDDLEIVDTYDFESQYYGAAFRKTDDKMVTEFDSAIEVLMKDGTIDALAERYGIENKLAKQPRTSKNAGR